jgi:hypothetical protein
LSNIFALNLLYNCCNAKFFVKGIREFRLLSRTTVFGFLLWFALPAALFALLKSHIMYTHALEQTISQTTNDTEKAAMPKDIRALPTSSLFVTILKESSLVLQLVSLLFMTPALGILLSTTRREETDQLPQPRSCWVILLAASLGYLSQLVTVIHVTWRKLRYQELGLVLSSFTLPLLTIQAAQWTLLLSAVLFAGSLLTQNSLQCKDIQVVEPLKPGITASTVYVKRLSQGSLEFQAIKVAQPLSKVGRILE